MRYDRQILMDEIGKKGQDRLHQASAAVVGCGGLGAPVLTYLAGAGIGTITLLDCDCVSESNLNRQFLHGTSDIGRRKTVSAEESLAHFNPNVRLLSKDVRLEEENADALLQGVDVVVDCSDSIGTRLTVNRSCLRQNIPLVEGGVCGFYGFVMVICRDSACLECLGYENTRSKEKTPVLGTTTGIIGSIQANEAIKIILGLPGILYGTMLNYDGIYYDFDLIEIKKSCSCRAHEMAEGG